MRVSHQSNYRAMRLALAGAAFAALAACGSDADDPSVAGADDLFQPSGLRIVDNGGGTITLYWSGINNEEDFDGYNIYGQKGGPSAFGITEGQTLKLLDDDGDVNEGSKDILRRFAYDVNNPFSGEQGGTERDGEKIGFLPIHQAQGETLGLPTCQPASAAGGACTPTSPGAATAAEEVTLNGEVSYQVTGLTVGETYCFLVVSSMSAGEEISSTTSEIRCIAPKMKFNVSLNAGTGGAFVDLMAMRISGSPDGATGASAAMYNINDIKQNGASAAPKAVNFESFSNAVWLTPGHNAAIMQVGTKMPRQLPAITGGAINYVDNESYSVPGQSAKVYLNHMYVVAHIGSDGNVYYYWLKTMAADASAGTATFEVMVPKKHGIDGRGA